MQVRELNDKYTSTNVRWGIVRNKNLSEQLDSATIVLTDVSNMNIEPYDLIQLTNESENAESWLIANVNKDYVTYNAPFKFDYTLDLMSLTKWLENIPIPSMSITNIGQNRTIKSYIQRVIERYVLPELSKYVSTATYTGLDSRFDAVCPEMSFNQTTAREYLDWMVGNFGCVIKIEYVGGRNIDVGVLDLNNPVETVPTQYIDDIKEMQSGEEYVTQFEHNIQEVIAQEPITEYVTLKGDGYVLNTDNALAILSHKVYDLLKVEVLNTYSLTIALQNVGGGSADRTDVAGGISNVDITKFIVPNAIFNTLEIPSKLSEGRPVDAHTMHTTKEEVTPYAIGTRLKTNCMVWNRGSNQIKFFNSTQDFKKYIFSDTTNTAIEAAIIEGWLDANWDNPYNIHYDGDTVYYLGKFHWEDLLLKVTYIPYISPRLLVEQKDNFSHLVTMQDNSTNTQTELGNFLSYSLEKNSKLGNTSKIITGMSKVENDDYTPKFAVGQIWSDEDENKYVLSTLEYTTLKNSILYKGTLTKNYTNRILNTLINREKRYYSLPDPSEVVDRKEVTKEWVKIQVVNSDFSGTAINTSDLFEKPLFAKFTATFKDNTTKDGVLYVDYVFGGNLITYSVSFIDNVSYATYKTAAASDGYKMNIRKYVDDDGELESLQFSFGKEGNRGRYSLYENLAIGVLPTIGPSSVSDYQLLWQSYTINLLKDSRERISWSLERIFYSDNSNIKLGNNFAELFKDKTKSLSITYTYSYAYGIESDTFDVTVNDFLTSQAWLMYIRPGTSGTLTVKESDDPNAIVYLEVSNFNARKYLVFTTGSKRG